SLWSQAIAVMESRVSMNGNRLRAMWLVAGKYRSEYEAIFPDPLPADAPGMTFPAEGKPGDPAFDALPVAAREQVNRVFVNIGKAIAAYEWELTSRRSPFDQLVEAGPGSEVISPAAKRGLRLFVGKASCIDCHRTPLLSDGLF